MTTSPMLGRPLLVAALVVALLGAVVPASDATPSTASTRATRATGAAAPDPTSACLGVLRGETQPAAPGSSQLVDVDAVGAGPSTWAVGSQPTGDGSRAPLVLRGNGIRMATTTGPASSGSGAGATSVDVVSRDSVWVAGVDGTSPHVVVAHWDGSHLVDAGLPPSSLPVAQDPLVSALRGGEAWVSTAVDRARPGIPRVYHWDGSAWSSTQVAGERADALLATSPTEVWLGGSGVTYPALHRWDGTAWMASALPGGARQVSALAGRSGAVYAYYADATSVPAMARWDGTSWSAMPRPPWRSVVSLSLAPDGVLWASGASTEELNGGNASITTPYVGRWDGLRWDSVAAVTQPDRDVLTTVRDVAGLTATDLRAVVNSPVDGGVTVAGLCAAVVHPGSLEHPRAAVVSPGGARLLLAGADLTTDAVVTDQLGVVPAVTLHPGRGVTIGYPGAGTYRGTLGAGRPALETAVGIEHFSTDTTGSAERVRWAQKPPPAGFRYEVQVRRPGAASFSGLATQPNDTGTTLRRVDDRGVYNFRARLVSTSDTHASGWSPVLSFTW